MHDPIEATRTQRREPEAKTQPATPAAVAVVAQPSVAAAAFDPDAYPLTRERVHALVQDGYITVTYANHHYLDFARTWVYHVVQAGITGFMVGAMDDDMLRALVGDGVNTWHMDSGNTKGDMGWGSANFHKMGRSKADLVQQFLQFNVSIVISDIDTAWLKNPLPYFDRFPKADILTSTDELRPTVNDDSLEKFPEAGASFNVGIMMFRPKSLAVIADWVKKLEDASLWDQAAFNELARLGHTTSNSSNKNLWKGDNGKLTIGVLPSSIFCSGHTYFTQHKFRELGLEPYVAHATFQYSGTPGKRHRFREAMLFHDPPKYYDSPKGFVTLTIDIPPELLAKADGIVGRMTADKMEDHFNLVHYQLQRLRTALLVATLTGRVIILPPIWCELDKYWGPLWNGNIGNSMFKKPFVCPMDHVFDIEGWWAKKLPPDFGPDLEWREYSFLDNSRMNADVNASRLVVSACGAEGCPGGAEVAGPSGEAKGAMHVAPGVTVAALTAALGETKAFKILELRPDALDALHDAWTGLPGDQLAQFKRRLKHYVSVNCCLDEQPGWVWYDFFSDVFPREDRFGRKFEHQFVIYKGETNVTAEGSPMDVPKDAPKES
ncbi:hypothetical protein FOA52_012612 [Chlamydomonas sp. UWO 241]|nr:hypothetical protein FOA52_012612 [Chlamydomonas sp. UWO 241]